MPTSVVASCRRIESYAACPTAPGATSGTGVAITSVHFAARIG